MRLISGPSGGLGADESPILQYGWKGIVALLAFNVTTLVVANLVYERWFKKKNKG